MSTVWRVGARTTAVATGTAVGAFRIHSFEGRSAYICWSPSASATRSRTVRARGSPVRARGRTHSRTASRRARTEMANAVRARGLPNCKVAPPPTPGVHGWVSAPVRERGLRVWGSTHIPVVRSHRGSAHVIRSRKVEGPRSFPSDDSCNSHRDCSASGAAGHSGAAHEAAVRRERPPDRRV